MPEAAIVIQRGLPDDQRDAAVVIFEEAFGMKMRTAVPDRDKRMTLMSAVYEPDHIVAALRDGRLVGMAGLRTRGGPYAGGLMRLSWNPRPYREMLGWWGSVRAVLGLRLAEHRPRSDELYIEGIAVTAEARGQGVGTRLLAEANEIASENGKRWVRLDVVDTNPRAKGLYERVGFRVTKVESIGYNARSTGFGAIISMEQPVRLEATAGTTERGAATNQPD